VTVAGPVGVEVLDEAVVEETVLEESVLDERLLDEACDELEVATTELDEVEEDDVDDVEEEEVEVRETWLEEEEDDAEPWAAVPCIRTSVYPPSLQKVRYVADIPVERGLKTSGIVREAPAAKVDPTAGNLGDV
jgi:hypothetical protein